MTTDRTAAGFLGIGVLSFVAGGLSVLLRALGAETLTQEATTSLAVAGLMALAVGAGLRRRS